MKFFNDFLASGEIMAWDKKIRIDHIKPVSVCFLDLNDENEYIDCCQAS